MKTPSPALQWAMAGVGLGFVVLAIAVMLRSAMFVASAQATEGQVTSEEIDRSGRHARLVAVVTFSDASGRRHETRTQVGGALVIYRKGEFVEVLYPPGRPEAARVGSFAELWSLPFVFGGTGIFFFLFGAFHLREAQLDRRLARTLHSRQSSAD